ncbi:MAG: metallophosphoesterase [Polaribacter sp.]|nr:metallophosphoesterase [Polaribacter sp.]
MFKKITFLFLTLFTVTTVFSQVIQKKAYDITTLNDGPFIFIEQNKLVQKEIINGELTIKNLPLNAFKTTFNAEESTYKNVEKIAALSDIHGQYGLAVTLLKNNKIIDKNLNWRFGKGHLVIAGDIFDRGPKVHETLLLVYKLEQQAKKEGGKVHFLLGNHEYMVLHNDLRYIHRKYRHTTRLLRMNYSDIYGKNTVLGRWLRSKATIIKINKDYFVHGGVSKEFITKTGFSSETMHTINATMRNAIDLTKEEMKATDFYKTYFSGKGLIWYRGYFYDNLEDTEINDILHTLDSKHIIVGHCSNKEVVQLFNHKIFGVDSSLKNGEYGELLLIKKNKYQRKTLKGKKKKFSK